LEALLRRCDHDADRLLSYHEFLEVIEFYYEIKDEEEEIE
jgi:hypothetical protein